VFFNRAGAALALTLALVLGGQAQTATRIQGEVDDALGRPLAHASVTLVDARGATLATTTSDAQGDYSLPSADHAVAVRATYPHLAPASVAMAAHPAKLVLGLSTVQATVNVTALGVAAPTAQVGNTSATITAEDLAITHPPQAATALRDAAGLSVVQSGEPGSVVSVFLRGAPSDFTEVLLDGVPIQRLDIGGYDFSNLSPTGLEEIQILRGPDSVVYGSDAAAGVIALRTRGGDEVSSPEFDSTTQAGAYATIDQQDQFLGHRGAVNYAFRFGYLGTHNQTPNAKFRDNTYGGDVGWHMARGAVLRLNLQRGFSDTGQPNALLFFGLPDNAFKHQGETYANISFHQQITPRWMQRIQFTQSQANLFSEVPGPAGVPDGFGDYDGLPVTIRGANGFSAQGQAILSFGGTFPQVSPSDTLRRDANWETELQLTRNWNLLGGYRYYDERGRSANIALSRHDHGAYGVIAGGIGNRLFVNGGGSVDRNTPFGTTANPQASLAYFARLGRGGFWDETRLRASGGTALKDPSLVEEEFSLYQELFSAAGGPALIRQFGLTPVRPQRARDFDAGVDQYLAGGRATVSLTWFDHRYYNVIEDIPPTAFPALGIPAAVAQTAQFGGEYNSLTESASGLEFEATARLTRGWRIKSVYTATAAKVLRSFSFDAQQPTFNPLFPAIPIGAFAPLVGGRPFRVAPQTGSVNLIYSRGRWTGDADAYFASRRDDSTFLTDSNFGNTLLLPNRNLDPAYGLLNLSGGFKLNPHWTLLAAIDNALDKNYQEVIGFPGERITGRLGVSWTWGGGAAKQF